MNENISEKPKIQDSVLNVQTESNELGGMMPNAHRQPPNTWSGKRVCWLVVLIFFSIFSFNGIMGLISWIVLKQMIIDMLLRQTDATPEYAQTLWSFALGFYIIADVIVVSVLACAIYCYRKATKACVVYQFPQHDYERTGNNNSYNVML